VQNYEKRGGIEKFFAKYLEVSKISCNFASLLRDKPQGKTMIR
jgi:hypothetical protein